MEDLTIAKMLSGVLPRLRTQEGMLDEHEALPENQYVNTQSLIEKATYIGIECEVENVSITGFRSPYWTTTKDGSLRNRGLEFVSQPLKVTRVERALTELFTKVLKPGYTYSDRTSIHIHMNVRTLTIPQLKSLVLTYMVFERALFNWVGKDRDQNIYCVPLHQINLTNGIIRTLEDIRHMGWMKYTALNLKPILEKGTVEFRHLYGTNNIEQIITWINFLLAMKRYALRTPPDTVIARILEINTVSDYTAYLYEVFDTVGLELQYPDLSKGMSDCVSEIKAKCLTRIELPEHNPKLDKFVTGKPPIGKAIRKQLNPEAIENIWNRLHNTEETRVTPPPPPELGAVMDNWAQQTITTDEAMGRWFADTTPERIFNTH